MSQVSRRNHSSSNSSIPCSMKIRSSYQRQQQHQQQLPQTIMYRCCSCYSINNHDMMKKDKPQQQLRLEPSPVSNGSSTQHALFQRWIVLVVCVMIVILISYYRNYDSFIPTISTTETKSINIKTISNNNSSNKDHNLPSKQQQQLLQYRSFPKWGSTKQEEDRHGIEFQPLLDFIVTSSIYNKDPFISSTTTTIIQDPNIKENHNVYRSTYDHINDVGGMSLPEILYIIEPDTSNNNNNVTLYISSSQRYLHNNNTIVDKLQNTERIMLLALQLLRNEYIKQSSSCTKSLWPSLCNILFTSTSTSNNHHGPYGFPFLAWYGDYTGCNYHNWQLQPQQQQYISIPLFTVAANVQCNYTIPFPNYYHIKSSMPSTHDWISTMELYHTKYPFHTKIPLVGWRGSLTGNIYNSTTKCSRWKMVQMVRQIEQQQKELMSNNKTAHIKPLFDIAITKIPPLAQKYTTEIEHDVGMIHTKDDLMKFYDFQKYRSILDIDGNSWSGRFGSLLCFNSIVLKVDASYVDYFYYKQQPIEMKDTDDDILSTIQPWKHYIPIKDDFSNLQEMAEFVLDTKNDVLVQQIIQNANQWCQYNMIESTIIHDMLYVWDRYVQLLYINHPKWNTELWQPQKEQYFNRNDPIGSKLRMIPLHLSDYKPYKNVAIIPKQ